MKRSNRLVLLIGIFLAVIAFVGIALTLSQGQPGQPTASAPTELPTVIALQDIPLGAVVTKEMVKTEPRAIGPDRKTTAFQNAEVGVIGEVARRPITAGAQLEAADFQVSQGIQQLVVPPSMRAIAVQVDQLSGVGTVIRAGDYVDMVVGLTGDKFPVVELNPDDDTITVISGLNTTSVKLLIEGMQVIGTLLPPPTAAAADPNAPAASGAPETTLTGASEIVILAVSAQQAEIIKFAQLDGSITLALRSPKDFIDENGQPIVNLPAGTTGVILKTLVDGYGVIRPELVEAILPAQ